ncbi:hypothetical protein Lalb_Chr12g0203581 [Lupinus albus]|uniref:Uncharacterized protein n=1 Tax=Lupinus albus TaxID=3870 RepID=A0A6A4PN08_LUPAL|nr:hypothetical protein Lalb_Chr12g0203581 [Lupinus albus]
MSKRKRANKANDEIETQESRDFMLLQLEQALQRQINAIRVVRDVEIENLVTKLRLIRSYFSKEQLQKPVLQVFEENFPNLSIVMSGEEDKIFDVKWKNKENVVADSLVQILSTNAGEMLLSVHGSPLCVFKENNMEVIHGSKIV